MVDNEELEKQLALIEDDEVLECTVIYKDGDTETLSGVLIAMGSYDESVSDAVDEDIFFYANSPKFVKGLCDPDNNEDFVLASFHGRKADYSTYQELVYKAQGWTIRLEGSTVGGRWEYTATDPNGMTYESGNEWCFEDSDGNKLERPIIPSFDDLLVGAVNCLSSDHNLDDLPEQWVRVE